MSLYKVFLLSGAAAFVSSAALAAEFQGKTIPLHASAIPGFHGMKAATRSQPAGAPAEAPLCGTGFGPELPTPDALISWNDTTQYGWNTGGAADFTCSAKTKIKQVWVYGYNTSFANPEQYNVTFYKNRGAGGSDEANDSRVVCAYTGMLAEGGGSFPTTVLSHIKLPTTCKLKPGKYWVEVQNNDSAGPWYWEVTSLLSGTQADWVDRNNRFDDGCTTLDNDRYLVDCLDYTYPDYRLELH
jgi:hypothetical protein